MARILAIYGSPRRKGNTARLMAQAVAGAREAGAEVEEVFLHDLEMSPCLEIYGCKKDGRCAIKDDFQALYDKLVSCQGMILASPIFFYTVSAQIKIMMDRCQSLWVKKYWIDKRPFGELNPAKKALLICVGATKGKKLFDGALMTVKYFLDTMDMGLWKSLLYRGLDLEGEVEKKPAYLAEARQAGADLARELDQA